MGYPHGNLYMFLCDLHDAAPFLNAAAGSVDIIAYRYKKLHKRENFTSSITGGFYDAVNNCSDSACCLYNSVRSEFSQRSRISTGAQGEKVPALRKQKYYVPGRFN